MDEDVMETGLGPVGDTCVENGVGGERVLICIEN